MSKECQFEIRIIRVLWVKREILKKIETADEPVNVYDEEGGTFSADILAYPELGPYRQGQIGINVTDSSVTPKLVQADGTITEFSPLKASDGRTWWVEMGKWKKIQGGSGYYDAPLCRHAGHASLTIGDFSVSLRISPPGFTEDEFEILLDEFRNGLWQLVLDSDSPVTATDLQQSTIGAGRDFIEAVRDHLRNVRNALEQPHCELRERQEQQLPSRVRPTTKTFQEIATKGNPRYLTGRGHSPSYNTPENQQLATMTYRLLRAMQALHRAALGVSDDFDRRAESSILRQKNLLESEGYIKIDPHRLQREINELVSQQRALNEAAKTLSLDGASVEGDSVLQIRVTSEINVELQETGFWSKVQEVNGKKRNFKVRFVFKDIPPDTLRNIFIKGMAYTVKGRFNHIYSHKETIQGKEKVKWYKYELSGIVSIAQVDVEQRLSYLKNGQNSLSNSNFIRKATTQEREETRRDCKAESERENRFVLARNLWKKTAVDLEPLIVDAKKLLNKIDSFGISYRLNLTMSGSMTYVHNPHYRGSLAAYRRAMDAACLDTSKLDQLFRLDEVGILDLPMVYERWCLLRIIRTLTEQFRFLPELSYRDNLFHRLTTEWKSKSSLTIRFSRAKAKREIILQYQPIIRREGRTDRTPDFILTVRSTGQSNSLNDEKYYSKLVIDAKCKRFAPVVPAKEGARLSDELQELIVNRGYDEDGENRVFVIHPGWNSKSSEDWKEFCQYGGGFFISDAESRPDWDKGYPDHTRGAVLLRPGIE